MAKKFSTQIGARDLEILSAIERLPLTVSQLRKLSHCFTSPFRDENNLRRRLRRLAASGLVRSWPYALICEGRAPGYFRLTREGYRLLHGAGAMLPTRRQFEEVSHGHHRHTSALSDLIVHLAASGHSHGVQMRHFARENSTKLEAGGYTLFPDCAFQLAAQDGRAFNYTVELDNGTERVRTKQDVESIERKIRGYDRHQAQYAAHDPQRYVVLLVTTRSEIRLHNMLDLANMLMSNKQRTVFLGATLPQLLTSDPFTAPVFIDHTRKSRLLIPVVKGVASVPRKNELVAGVRPQSG